MEKLGAGSVGGVVLVVAWRGIGVGIGAFFLEKFLVVMSLGRFAGRCCIIFWNRRIVRECSRVKGAWQEVMGWG